MKKLKEELKYGKKGITLISLVVTIIVLLILAGITISMLFGENGLLNKATDATEEYSKAEAKEKVELLLSEYVIDKATGENEDFANFLRKNLQVGVAENDDNTYSFMLGEWQVITDENKVISIEKFKLDVDNTYPNVASMKADTELTDGQLVQTQSYWDTQYGGSAYYDIVRSTSLTVDDGKCILLDNGLYAELHPINDTVTVNQFGAYGDGEHDDAMAIENALNAGVGNISFLSEEYRLDQSITIYTSDINILGNDKIVYTDNNYIGNQYYAISINSNLDNGTDLNSEMLYNIKLFNLNVETRGENSDYSIQMRIYNVTNLSIENCNFIVQEIENNKNRSITNMWIYTGWHNVNIDGCKFINKTLCSRGTGGIWISEMNPEGKSDNLMFKNNYMEKSGHDEILAIYSGDIENVLVENNEFYTEESQLDNPSDLLFRIGVDETNNIKKVKFINNNINTESKGSLFSIQTNSLDSENIIIENNIINHTFIREASKFFAYSGNSTNVSIRNNNININSEYAEIEDFSFCDSNYNVLNNNIVINKNIRYLLNAKNVNFVGNNIAVNGSIENIVRDASGLQFINNNITITGNFASAIFLYGNCNIESNVYIAENSFTINDNQEWEERSRYFLHILNSKINNNKIEVYNNDINVEKQTNIQNLILLNTITDKDTQTVYLRNNNYGIFKRIYFYGNSSSHIIMLDENRITESTEIE